MRVTMDGEQVLDHAPTLEAALNAASTRAAQRGRLILEVNADGQPLPAEALDAPGEHTDAIGELSLVSADPNAFGLNILHEAAEAVEQAVQRQAKAADLLERGETSEAFESMSSAMLLWDMVQQAVTRTRAFAPPADEACAQRVNEQVERLRGQLEAVRGSLESEDWAGLGDTLRYDLADLGSAWKDVLRAWADGLPRPGAS